MNNFWKEMELITRGRMVEIEIAIPRAQTGMSMRWLQGMLETNRKWNEIARAEIDAGVKYQAMQQKIIEVRKQTFRGNDDT